MVSGCDFGPLKLGFSGFAGKGLGLAVPLEDNPAILLPAGRAFARKTVIGGSARWSSAASTFAGGAGITRAKRDRD